MKKLTFIASAILTMVMFSATVAAQKTEVRNLSRFSKINFAVPGNLNIRIGSEFKVALEGDEDLLAEIETGISNDRLTIRIKEDRRPRNWWANFNNKKVTVNITMPAIAGLSVSGSGTAEIFDSFTTNSFDLSVSGSGRLIINDMLSEKLNCSVTGSGNIAINNMSGEELNCRVTGSGNITVRGNGSFNKADISITGSGRYNGELIKLETANITVTGSGSCNCNVANSLEARATGSGNITYLGNPPRIDTRVTGSGRIRTK
jgi:hypothetical protein